MEPIERCSFTIVRAHGLSFLRPEKSWRPIVTITVDEHENHETVLGSDGQNPNLKAPFFFDTTVKISSRVDIKVWQKSQSKRKGRRRNLVATACHTLGELIKRQEADAKVEVRLKCQLPPKRGCATKGKPQNGAFISIKIRPPTSLRTSLFSCDAGDSHSEASSSDIALSDTLTHCHTSDNISSFSHSEDERDAVKPETPKKPRIRGYRIGSDDDRSSSEDSHDDCEKKPLLNHPEYADDGWEDQRNVVIHVTSYPFGWLMKSILPSYTEKVPVQQPIRFLERILATFTTYKDLKDATLDSHYEAVFTRLQQEWTYVGGLLVALAAVDTAVFSMSSGPGSLFNVDRYAQNAIAASSVASGLGVACDAWFLLRYNWADLHTFRTRARDLYGSYFFFALSSRLPSLSMLISAFSLLAFLGRVAYNSWPEAVIVICIVFGVIMVLQFLVYGAHWCIRRVVDGARMGGRCAARTFEWMKDCSGIPSPPPPYDST